LLEGLGRTIVTLLRLVLRVVLLAAGQALIGDLHRLQNREQEFNFNGTYCDIHDKKLTLSILKKD
jgi:hypothetical protein